MDGQGNGQQKAHSDQGRQHEARGSTGPIVVGRDHDRQGFRSGVLGVSHKRHRTAKRTRVNLLAEASKGLTAKSPLRQ